MKTVVAFSRYDSRIYFEMLRVLSQTFCKVCLYLDPVSKAVPPKYEGLATA